MERDNSVSERFRGDPRILYISLHALESQPIHDVGEDQGKGYTVHVGLPLVRYSYGTGSIQVTKYYGI